jgi:aminopeptidase N
MSQAAIRHSEEVMPGVDYPHPALFVFDGLGRGLGMEFPMMVNQRMYTAAADYHRSVGVTFHEIAHMYFPFSVGTNEKRFAWMDEGLAVYMPFYGRNLYTDTPFNRSRLLDYVRRYYLWNVGTPIMGPSMYIKKSLYVLKSYTKAGLAFLVLEDLLGEAQMRQGMQAFIRRWQGKHPLPWDLFFTFNDVLSEDLSWFWQPWFYEAHIPDVGITAVEHVGTDYWITLENHGGLPSPVDLTVTYKDSSTAAIHKTARIWEEGNTLYRFPVNTDQELLSVELIEKQMVDMDSTNNHFIVNTR